MQLTVAGADPQLLAALCKNFQIDREIIKIGKKIFEIDRQF
jgi:hypothetical protein